MRTNKAEPPPPMSLYSIVHGTDTVGEFTDLGKAREYAYRQFGLIHRIVLAPGNAKPPKPRRIQGVGVEHPKDPAAGSRTHVRA